MLKLRFVLLHFVVTVSFAGAVSAATFTVTTNIDSQDNAPGNGVCSDSLGRCTLRAAITEANALAGADTINIPAGTYNMSLSSASEDANLGGDWDITDSVTIVGSGSSTLQAATTTGTATERVLDIVGTETQVSISGVTIRNGRIISGIMRGGGIRSVGDLQLSNVTVTANVGTYGGGGIYNLGSLSITSSNLVANKCFSTSSGCSGGAIESELRADEVISFTNTNFDNNSANSTVNNRRGSGGAVAVSGLAHFYLNIVGGRFYSNIGGAVNSQGGGLYVLASNGWGRLNFNNVEFTRHDFNAAGTDLRGVAIALETISTGRILTDWTRLNMHRNPLNTSDASDNATGGHISMYSRGWIINAKISNSMFYGGKAFRGGAMAMQNITSQGSLTLVSVINSSFVGNTANNFDPNSPNDGDGGAIYMITAPNTPIHQMETHLEYTTFANNSALRGPAIYTENPVGQLVFRNSVVAYHGGGSSDMYGPFLSGGYNHFDEVAGTYPGLQPTDTYGPAGLVSVPGKDYLVPLTTSPVVNAIPYLQYKCTASGVGIDQIFKPRPFNNACDKGAIELQEYPLG